MSYLKSSTSSHPRGLTLPEVLAGLTLLATLLVATILSYGAHIRQVRTAQQRLQAIELLDSMLVRWHEAGEVPRGDEGVVEKVSGWRWRSFELPSEDLKRYRSNRIRVEIFDSTAGNESQPLAFVELLGAETNTDMQRVARRP